MGILSRPLNISVSQTRSAVRRLSMTHSVRRSHPPLPMGAAASAPDIGALAAGGSVSKGKARATAPLPIQRTVSDVENQPLAPTPAACDDASSSISPASQETETLPLYSYKQYPPTPAVVYTRHEEEANDLVECLKGPLGFDLEWPVVFRRGRRPSERRTSLVQICDSRMILLVQVSAMNSTC